MKKFTNFDFVKSFEIYIFNRIFESHNYSTMFGKKPAFCQKSLTCYQYPMLLGAPIPMCIDCYYI